MNKHYWRIALCAGGVALTSSKAFAADISFSGFASFVGGKAIKTVDLSKAPAVLGAPDNNSGLNPNRSSFRGDPSEGTINGLVNPDAYYTEDISFRPDSKYGLQIDSDLSENLTVAAQIVGKGSRNYQAEIEWAYLSYDLNNYVTLQAGRQRVPTFYYSAFQDVGYAYHWIRPPTNLYNGVIDTYEGISSTFKHNLGDWNTSVQLYTGNSESENSFFAPIHTDNLFGMTFTLDTYWATFRGAYQIGDTYTDGSSQTTKEDPTTAAFGSLSAHMNFGDLFILGEFTRTGIQDFLENSDGSIALDLTYGYMFSAGYEILDFTPHITYSTAVTRYSDDENTSEQVRRFGLGGSEILNNTLTLGIRWDFHPAAALKLEYSSSKDKSDPIVQQLRGLAGETDVFNAGIDLIF